jgi:hypothetical protein
MSNLNTDDTSSDKELFNNFINEISENERNASDQNADTDKETRDNLEKMLEGLSEEQIMELLKSNNPYSTTINAEQPNNLRSVAFSLTNMRMEFVKTLVTTSSIGYLFQRLMHWNVDEEVRPVSVETFLEKGDESCKAPDYVTDRTLQEKYHKMHETMHERVIVWKFLKEVFNFNPDEHVRSSWYPVKTDKGRDLIGTKAAKLAVQHKNTVRHIKKDRDHYPEVADLPSVEKATELGQIDNPVYEVIPSADYYHSFTSYMEDHYDELIKTVYTITGEKPDIDVAINVYDTFESETKATEFRDNHMEEVIAGIFNTPMNEWTILAPYKANRDKENFFNRETLELQGMLDSREDKSRLAKDMLQKRVKKRKDKSVKEHGPDSDKFKEWSKDTNSGRSNFGKEYDKCSESTPVGLSDTEQTATDMISKSRSAEYDRISSMHTKTDIVDLQSTMTEKEWDEYQKRPVEINMPRSGIGTEQESFRVIKNDNDECPDDAVEVGIIKLGGGGTKVHRDIFYTAAEAQGSNMSAEDKAAISNHRCDPIVVPSTNPPIKK